MTISARARQAADAAPLHQSAAVLRECADALDAKDAELAALREAVGALPEYAHSLPCPHEDYDCICGTEAANAARAAARKLAGIEDK